jgi:hypothetical protein
MRKKLCSGALSILGNIIRALCRHFTLKNDDNIVENLKNVKPVSLRGLAPVSRKWWDIRAGISESIALIR